MQNELAYWRHQIIKVYSTPTLELYQASIFNQNIAVKKLLFTNFWEIRRHRWLIDSLGKKSFDIFKKKKNLKVGVAAKNLSNKKSYNTDRPEGLKHKTFQLGKSFEAKKRSPEKKSRWRSSTSFRPFNRKLWRLFEQWKMKTKKPRTEMAFLFLKTQFYKYEKL